MVCKDEVVLSHGRGVGAGQPQVHGQFPVALLQLASDWPSGLALVTVALLLALAHGVHGHDDVWALHLSSAALAFLLFLLSLLLLFFCSSVSLLLFLLLFDLLPEMSRFSLDDWLQGLSPPLAGGGHLQETAQLRLSAVTDGGTCFVLTYCDGCDADSGEHLFD